MGHFLTGLLSNDFMPHRMCYLNDAAVLWLNVISDLLTALAYYLIPLLLFYFLRRRRDVTFRWVFVAFGFFILACGTTHLLGAITVWNPVYRLEGVVKAVTALASMATFILLARMMPEILALPSPAALAEVNRQLAEEVEERRSAETEVRQMNEELETRVLERTAQLTESEASFRQLADAMPQMVWVAGPDGQLEYSNLQWSAYAGILPGSPGGPAWTSLLHADDAPSASEQWEHSVRTGEPLDGEYRLRGKEGGYRWFLGRSRPVLGDHGQVLRWFGTFTDIDDHKRDAEELSQALEKLRGEMKRRREVEGQLLQAQKMEAIGRLAGGVAHDFNNLLTVILGYNELLREESAQRPVALDFVLEIHKAAERAAALTNQLLAFSRRQVSVPRVLDLNEVVRQIEKMLHRIIGEDVRLNLHLAGKLPLVKVDPNQIDQVIMNLAVNSRDAMPDGGQLTLETAPFEWSSDYGDGHPNLLPGRYVMLAVSDNGCGMDARTRSRLFEPFFTTKEKGKGTGLGLSIVYGIVKQSGGDILVYSEPGQGTVFKIFLPVAEQSAPGGPTGTPAVEEAGKREHYARQAATKTILLVEDEIQVRSLTRTMLSRLGYRVVDAGSAAEALELLRRDPQPISLLLADIVMPEMNGPELARQVLALRPGIQVLFMSGYTGGGVIGQGLLDPSTPFIQKPFTAETLAERVRTALALEG